MKSLFQKLFYRTCLFVDALYRDTNARILMYHTIDRPDLFFNVSESRFKEQISYLQKEKYRFISLDTLLRTLENSGNLNRCIVITFDDGHVDFQKTVLSIIKEKNIPVTLFWPTNVAEGILRLSTGETCPLLNKEQIKEITDSPLVELGSHSVTHRNLPTLAPVEVSSELKESYRVISALSKYPIPFAYPRGQYTEQIKNTVREIGFSSACTVRPGMVKRSSDTFELPRLSIASTTDMLAFKAKLTWLYAIVRS